jgi:HlyD family secretion protein
MAKRQYTRQRTNIIIAILAVVLAGGSFAAWNMLREKTIEVTTEKVSRKEIIHVVTATGKIEPEIEVTISPDVSGEIIELPVKEGQLVTKGDLLFKIQPDVYVNQVEQSRAQMNLARSQSLEAKARKLKAEDDFRKASILYKDKLISQTDYIAAKTNAEASRASYEASMYAIQQNKSLLDQNQERLEKTVIQAPISGSIISLKSKLGERVVGTGQFPGTEVLSLADLDSMQVEVEVNENDIVNVHPGNPVTVTVDAYGERKFKGIVHEISNSAITQAAGTQEEVNHNRLLKPGMSATADIETDRIPNALAAPIQSITIRSTEGGQSAVVAENREEDVVQAPKPARENGSEQGVFVVKAGKVRFRKVTTGTTDNTHIIITSGLKEGEEVVSGSYSAITRLLHDGSRIRTGKRK